MSDPIRDLKSYTAKEFLKAIEVGPESRQHWLLTMFSMVAARHMRNAEYQVWSHENHAIELDNNDMMDQRIEYVHQNPVKAGIVERPEEYIYSSAAYFAGCNDLVVCVVP